MKKISILLVILTCIFFWACNVISNSSDDSKEPAASSDTEDKATFDTESNEETSDIESQQTAEKDSETTEESSETTEIYENNWDGMKNADGYGYTVSFVGWANDSDREELYQGQTGRYPIFKIDTVEELEQFKSKCSNIFDFSQGYAESLPFEDTMEKTKWDTEAFYKEHSLLVIYVESNSGSLRFGVKEIVTTDNSMSIDVVCLNHPEVATDDMVGWFLLIEIQDEEAQKYTSFITD